MCSKKGVAGCEVRMLPCRLSIFYLELSIMIKLLMQFCKFNFGEFEEEEFRKFIRLGFILFMIVGIHWIIRPLTSSAFIQLIGGAYMPYARMVSAAVALVIVLIYTSLVGKCSKSKLFSSIPVFYGLVTTVFSFCVYMCQSGKWTSPATITIVGYGWFAFLESWAGLLITSFWGIVSETTEPQSASRGISLIYLIGQIGGVLLPYPVVSLPHFLHMETDLASMLIVSCLMMSVSPVVKYFFRKTPEHLMVGFSGKQISHQKQEAQDKKKAGFMEGLRLLWSCKYLICIFIFGFVVEFLMATFDFSFKLKAGETFSGVELSNYFGIYSSVANMTTTLLLLLGISNVQRLFGVTVALIIVPILYGVATCSFLMFDSLTLLFILMVCGKAVKFGLSSPTLKLLYVPTSEGARLKAQAWIDTFESKLSKWMSSLINALLRPMQIAFGDALGMKYYLLLIGVISLPLLAILCFVAMYLGKVYKKAVDDKVNVC
jgi:AAA family ATP:ADP antiporter